MKTCPKCGWFMFKKPLWSSSKRDIELSEYGRCQNCGYEEDGTVEDHALDATRYVFEDYAKYLSELPSAVGVEAYVREFHTKIDEITHKAYIEGCVHVNVDPDALNKTAELNSELQFALKKALMKLRKWIPVEEGMPDSEFAQHTLKFPNEECVEVIVLIKGSSVATTLYYNGKCFEDEYGSSTYNVTHWMPMPEPPEVQNE